MLFGPGVTRGGARRLIGWAEATAAAIVARVDSVATDIRRRTIALHFIGGTDWLETSVVGSRERGEGGVSRVSLMEALQVLGESSGARSSLARCGFCTASGSRSDAVAVAQRLELTHDRGEMSLESRNGHRWRFDLDLPLQRRIAFGENG